MIHNLHQIHLRFPLELVSLFIQFPWNEQRPGYFIRLRTYQLDRSDQSIKAPTQTILSQREKGKLVSSLIAIEPEARPDLHRTL